MTNQQKIIKAKVGIPELARQLGNVSRARKAMGCSRDSFCRFKTPYNTSGEAALQEISRRKPNAKNRIDPAAERAVLDFARERPAYGQPRVSNELRKRGAFVSPGGGRSIWLRHDLAAFKGRLKALEARMAQEGIALAESQLAATERAREEKEARGETETERPGYLGAQDTYYVGNIKGVGHIYQQTFVDTCTKAALCKLHDRKNAPVAADALDSEATPFFDSRGIPLLRALTDRGSECCGNRERHEYALYLELENIECSRTKAKSPQAQLQEQANRYGQLFRWYLEFSNHIDRVTFWGRDDISSWRSDAAPTLFDRHLNPKPAFFAAMDAAANHSAAPFIEATTFRAGESGIPYRSAVVSGGRPAPVLAVTGGVLPPGLRLSPTGAVYGTPTQGGTFNFTVTATSALGSTSQGFSIAIVAATN